MARTTTNFDFKAFNKRAIVNDICNLINDPFTAGYSYGLIAENLFSRLKIFFIKAQYYVIEENYIENEWKEMVSLHYINTSYKTDKVVSRIHLFSESIADSAHYLGCFHVRSIDEIRMLLSFIYPNWDLLRDQDDKNFYIMTYEHSIHINGLTFKINTFPFFAQDGIATRCVHADIIMMTKYLSNVNKYKEIRISEIVDDYSFTKIKCYPSLGLMPSQIVEIFNKSRIPIKLFNYRDDLIRSSFDNIIRSYIESGIPVMLAIKEHVVLIIGHTKNDCGQHQYIVYDDSAALTYKLLKGETSFVSAIPWKSIKNELERLDFFMVSDYDRVYMDYLIVSEYFERHIKDSGFYEIIDSIFHIHSALTVKRRIFMADNSKVKMFLKEQIVRNRDKLSYEEFTKFLNLSLPHYIWYCELSIDSDDNEIFVYLADPTYHNHTTKTIFYNYRPFFLKEKYSLLKLV